MPDMNTQEIHIVSYFRALSKVNEIIKFIEFFELFISSLPFMLNRIYEKKYPLMLFHTKLFNLSTS